MYCADGKMMTTEQLNCACNCDGYLGVFPLNKLPENLDDDSTFIVNTDTDNLPGRHWIAVRGNKVFEPTGLYYPSRLTKHLYKYFDALELNYDSYQNPFDSSCGLYCLYFIHYGTIDILPYAYQHNLSIVSSFTCTS